MTAPLLLIAAGGTGGHMFPAQALAEAMIARGWRVRLSTDARGARYAGGFPKAVEVVVSGSGTFARGGALAKLLVPFKIAGGILGATVKMLSDRPAVVVGFGGYPTIPALSASTTSAASQTRMTSLGQADFIKLMTTQMKLQDPLEPVDNKEMIAQMAQFSSLAGINDINATLQAISAQLAQVMPAQSSAQPTQNNA